MRTRLNFTFIRTLPLLFAPWPYLTAGECVAIYQCFYSAGHAESQWYESPKAGRWITHSNYVQTHAHGGSPFYNHAYATSVTQRLSTVAGRRNADACYLVVKFSGPFVSISINLLRCLPIIVFGYLLGLHVCLITYCFVFSCTPCGKTKRGSDKSSVTNRKTIDLETKITNI